MANRNVARAVRLALIAAGASSAGFQAPVVLAQDAELEQIVVTGSRIARAELESDTPLSLVSSEDIARTGLVNVGDILQNLTTTDGTGLRPISTATNNNPGGANQISLRNLGAERTLVLVDGRRWVTDGSGIVDLNTIPASMIERVEILRDGASAIYGSDAIAGVINIITKKQFDGLQLDAYYGSTSKGDGAQDNYGLTVGATGERSRGMLSISYSSQGEIMAGDRRISKTSVYGCSDPATLEFFGLFCGSGTGEYGRFFVTGLPGSYTLRPGEAGTVPGDFNPWSNAARYNFAPDNYLQLPIERTNMFAAGGIDLTDNIELYTKLIYNKVTSSQQIAPVPATMDMSGAQGPQWRIPIDANQYFNPWDAAINRSFWRASPVGPRTSNYDYDTYGINLGVKGDFEAMSRTFNWDAGLQYNDGQYDRVGENYVNLFNLRNALGPSFRDAGGVLRCGTPGSEIRGCVPLNIFGGPDLGVGAGVVTPEEAAQMLNYIGYTQVATSGLTSTNWYGDISSEIFDLPAGPLGIAVGVEYRKNEYFEQPDTLVVSGGSSDNFTEPTKGQITVSEYYAEINVPILKDLPGAKELTVNAAMRWSDYSSSGRVGLTPVETDPGSPSTPKVSLTWRPLDQLMVRGSWGETFRAPSVVDLYAGGGESFPQAQDPCNTANWANLSTAQQDRCLQDGVPVGGVVQTNTQIRSLIGGNPFLEPEEGENFSYGFVWEPTFVDNLSLTLDYWNIKLDNAIQTFGVETVLGGCYEGLDEAYCPFVERVPTGEIAQVRAVGFNAAEREADGIDFGVRYSFDTEGFGSFGFQWDTTYTMSDKFKLETDSEFVDSTGFYDGEVHWEWRSNLTTTWSLENFSAAWTMRYTSSLEEACEYYLASGGTNAWNGKPVLCTNPGREMSNDLADYFFWDRGTEGVNVLDDMLYHDLQLSYAARWNGTFTVGGRNIFGSEPPTVNNSFAHSFDGAYDLPGGAYWYASYKQNF